MDSRKKIEELFEQGKTAMVLDTTDGVLVVKIRSIEDNHVILVPVDGLAIISDIPRTVKIPVGAIEKVSQIIDGKIVNSS